MWTDAVEDARKEVALIAPRLSWITVVVKGATGKEARVTLAIDGIQIPTAAFGLPRAVDKGDHAVTAKVDYGKGAEGAVHTEEGGKQTITIEVTLTPPPAGAKAAVAYVEPKAGPPPPPPPRSWAIRRTAGVGGAGIVVGAITGSMVLGLHGTLAAACGTNGKCPPQDQSTLDNYNRDGLISTISFIAGGVIAATGAVLILTVPSRPQAPRVGFSVAPTVGGGTLTAVGSF